MHTRTFLIDKPKKKCSMIKTIKINITVWARPYHPYQSNTAQAIGRLSANAGMGLLVYKGNIAYY